MATLSAQQKTQVQAAVDLLLQGTAYETPFAEDVIERLAPAAESAGFMSQGAFFEAVRDRPISTLLRWILVAGA